MPRVQVLTDIPGRNPETLLTERLPSEMLSNAHYADQLVERMGWALVDAEEIEQQPMPPTARAPNGATLQQLGQPRSRTPA
jgi:hypothetical protein